MNRWVGIFCDNTVGACFNMDDGSPVLANWNAGEPNGVVGIRRVDPCVHMLYTTALWNDVPCNDSESRAYTCEQSASGRQSSIVLIFCQVLRRDSTRTYSFQRKPQFHAQFYISTDLT